MVLAVLLVGIVGRKLSGCGPGGGATAASFGDRMTGKSCVFGGFGYFGVVEVPEGSDCGEGC